MVLSICRGIITSTVVLLAMAALTVAQDYRGKLQGTVTDEAHAAIPGAHVVLRNIKTGVETSRQSDSNGHFIFDFIDSGEYMVVVEQPGFKKAVQENVIVQNRSDVTVDVVLLVGAVAESVTVEA